MPLVWLVPSKILAYETFMYELQIANGTRSMDMALDTGMGLV